MVTTVCICACKKYLNNLCPSVPLFMEKLEKYIQEGSPDSPCANAICIVDFFIASVKMIEGSGITKLSFFKGNGYTFQESNSQDQSCHPCQFGSTSKGKNLLPEEQILSF